MRRGLLFAAKHLAIPLVLGIVSSLLEGALARSGVEIPQLQLLVFAALFGLGGSLLAGFPLGSARRDEPWGAD